MPQITPLVLTDKDATDLTFSPLKAENGQVTFVNRTDGQPSLDKTCVMSLKKQGNGSYRVIAKLSIPVVQVVDGISVVVDTDITEINFRSSSLSTGVNRLNHKALSDSLIANTNFSTMVTALEGMY